MNLPMSQAFRPAHKLDMPGPRTGNESNLPSSRPVAPSHARLPRPKEHEIDHPMFKLGFMHGAAHAVTKKVHGTPKIPGLLG